VEFTGRLAVAEIFEPTEQERMMILQWKLGLEMFDDIKKRWYITLQEDAYIKTYNGLTTMEEVRRVV
jgi:type II secretory ATPase GspE/PulE/Tfp pilus assembly ATPase PilB-like protein